MRTLGCLLIAITGLVTASAAVAQDDLPYEAYVMPTMAAVYSGPVEPRYVTHEIPRGAKVEVYERRDDWLGIRPPEGSYSWVPAAGMRMAAEPGVAEAAEDGVSAWIGSSAERVEQHQSSVQLKRGEVVEVLGKKEVETGVGPRETWLKIAPPAGEFRWVHASQVSREAPSAFTVTQPTQPDQAWASRPTGRRRAVEIDVEAQPAADAAPPREAGPFRRSSMELRDLTPPLRPAAFRREAAANEEVQLVAHDMEVAETPTPSQPLSPDGFVPRQPRASQQRSAPAGRGAPTLLPAPASRVASAPPKTQSPASPAAGPIATAAEAEPAMPTGMASAAVQKRLEEIDVALSLMISGDRSQWNLAALKREVQKLIEQGATPVDRGEARFLLEKIERFAEAFGVEDDDGTIDLPVGSAAARKAALEAATAPKYDGTGYLTPVRSAKPIAPFALLDESGNRLCYVTPVPGFNLRAYENRRIGVFGKRGYMSDAGAAHLLAERVVDLDKQTR